MEDARIWEFEKSLWTGSPEHYAELIDEKCVMVVPAEPHIQTGEAAVEAVSDTPRWNQVTLSERTVERPEEGLIVIGYHAEASKDDGKAYKAYCSSTIRRLEHDKWRVVQHSQSIAPVATV